MVRYISPIHQIRSLLFLCGGVQRTGKTGIYTHSSTRRLANNESILLAPVVMGRMNDVAVGVSVCVVLYVSLKNQSSNRMACEWNLT